jgi:photosystem II stability/assembly factor-like uncharacterized protein
MRFQAKTSAFRNLLILMSVAVFLTSGVWGQQWTALGPDGGDVRSLAHDPHNPDRLFLGTSSGELFLSKDGGRGWSHLAHVGERDDYVVDHVLIDPRDSALMYASAWSVESQAAGDVFRSKDGGKTWQAMPGMHNKSVRALAQAASNPNVLVAGALDGVFRSTDGGDTWQRMSPANHADLKNFESIAIDPKDPNTVYAGTWHLPWKTSDGGVSWRSIKKGMIDDSDVFSIIVDPGNPSVVFASACSGIYKSERAGELFSKIQGIPFSARRTRVLHQDPANPSTVYAGTTEGLWKTADLGKTWRRVTNPNVTVNDVFVDPRNSQRVLLATDRSGILASSDGSATWVASNQGFAHRTVTAILVDRNDLQTMYVGLVNDKEYGGVFVSSDGGAHWQQRSTGLSGRDVFTLRQAANGTVIAGTNRGIFLMGRNDREWRASNSVVNESVTMRTVKTGGKAKKVPVKSATRSELSARVSDVEILSNRWMAATTAGMFSSADQGKTWSEVPVLGREAFVAVRSGGELLVAAKRSSLMISADGGNTWKASNPASYISKIYGVTVTPESHIFVSTREGAFRSADGGATWEHMLSGLPSKEVASILYDSNRKRLLATSNVSGVVFESTDAGHSWQRKADMAWPIRALGLVHGKFVGATPFLGIVAQAESSQPEAAAAGSRSNH